MKTVVCDPEPFGFGPSADIFGVAKELARRKGVKVIVLAVRQLIPFFRKEKKLSVIKMHYPRDFEKLKKIVAKADAYVTATNDTNLKILRDAKIKTPIIYIDSLFWYWGNHHLPNAEYKHSSDLYLACNYFDAAEVAKKQWRKFKKLKVIPPIISKQPRSETKDQIVVNFGGLTSIFTTQNDANDYAELMSKMFFHNMRLQEKFGKVFVSGNFYTMKKMKEYNRTKNIFFLSLDHERFMKLLSESRLFLTSPGIHALYEGYATGIPTIGFFPSNHTQELQLRYAAKLVKRKHIMDWSLVDKDYYKKLSGGPEKEVESIKIIKGYISQLRENAALYDRVMHKLNKTFSNIEDFLSFMKEQEKKSEKKLRLNGAQIVVKYLEKENYI